MKRGQVVLASAVLLLSGSVSDQRKPQEFAGEKVIVIGTYDS